jgi:hypothetical protein
VNVFESTALFLKGDFERPHKVIEFLPITFFLEQIIESVIE